MNPRSRPSTAQRTGTITRKQSHVSTSVLPDRPARFVDATQNADERHGHGTHAEDHDGAERQPDRRAEHYASTCSSPVTLRVPVVLPTAPPEAETFCSMRSNRPRAP